MLSHFYFSSNKKLIAYPFLMVGFFSISVIECDAILINCLYQYKMFFARFLAGRATIF